MLLDRVAEGSLVKLSSFLEAGTAAGSLLNCIACWSASSSRKGRAAFVEKCGT